MSSRASSEDTMVGTTKPPLARRILVCAHAAAVLALLYLAIGIFGLKCENFGCMGIGVAWFAWACSFAVVLILGLITRYKLPLGGWRKATSTCLVIQLITAALLALLWLFKTLA